MKIKNTESFDLGFVEACVDKGLNQYETDVLHKAAKYIQAFNNPEFRKGFDSVVGPHRVENLSNFEKAACIKKYLETLEK